MEFQTLAENRYSCRQFSDRKVELDLIMQIVEAANQAPTAVNKQPFKIFWLRSAEAKQQLEQVSPCTFGADTFLVVGYRTEEAWVRAFDDRNFADVDASIAATYMMLRIYDLGLATTWVGHFDSPRLKQLYPEMRDYELIALFPVGYAAADSEPSPRHYQRKSRDEILQILE